MKGKFNEIEVLTAEHIKHVNDEEVVESDLTLWNGTRGSVKLRHHNGDPQPFLIVGLKEGAKINNMSHKRDSVGYGMSRAEIPNYSAINS